MEGKEGYESQMCEEEHRVELHPLRDEGFKGAIAYGFAKTRSAQLQCRLKVLICEQCGNERTARP